MAAGDCDYYRQQILHMLVRRAVAVGVVRCAVLADNVVHVAVVFSFLL